MHYKIIIRLIISIGAVLIAAAVVPGIEVAGIFTALVVAIILGLVNITLRPILILLTLPINLITLGLFTFVINASMLLFVAAVVKGFEVSGFTAAFLGALVISLIHYLTHRLDRTV